MVRGEIYWASVLPTETRGREQNNQPGAPRPWLILSNGKLETRAEIVVACPITSSNLDLATGNMRDFRLHLTPDMVGVTDKDDGIEAGVILVDQVRAMSVERFRVKGAAPRRLGKLKSAHLSMVDQCLADIFNLATGAG